MIIVDLLDQILDLMGPTQEFKGHLDVTRDLLDPTTHPQGPLGPHRNIPERIVDLMDLLDLMGLMGLMDLMDPMEQMSPKMGIQPTVTSNVFHPLAT